MPHPKNPVELYRTVAKFGDGDVFYGALLFSSEKRATETAKGTAKRFAATKGGYTSYGVQMYVCDKSDLLPYGPMGQRLKEPFVGEDGVRLSVVW